MRTPREQAAYAWVEEVFASPEDWSLGDVLDAFEAGAQWATENPRRVETAEEPDAAPTGQRNMWDSFCDDCECIHCKPMDWEPWHGKASS